MWKTIEKCDNYEICETGEIRNIENKHVMKKSDRSGVVSLSQDGKKYGLSPDKLVRLYFPKEDEKIIWKSIPNFSTYEVSNLGNIRHNIKLNVLTALHQNGYLVVSLINNDKKFKQVSIHRIVAITFIPNDNNSRIYVNHIDGNKHNNNVINLEWNTPKENSNHAIDTGLKKIFCRIIHLHDKNNNLIDIFNGANEAERITGISRTSILGYCTKKRKFQQDNFIWKYADDNRIGRTKTDMEDLSNEIWKQFNDSNYEISTTGRVRNKLTKYIIKSKIDSNERESVCIRIGDERKQYIVSRLVALTYLPNDKNLPEVNHIDKNTLNNKMENLEWISGKDNMKHSFAKKVVQMDLDENVIKIWDSLTDAVIETNIKQTTLASYCKKIRTHTIYKWKFTD